MEKGKGMMHLKGHNISVIWASKKEGSLTTGIYRIPTY
jgi:hypothetical protein